MRSALELREMWGVIAALEWIETWLCLVAVEIAAGKCPRG
jgi:hypothetical protein